MGRKTNFSILTAALLFTAMVPVAVLDSNVAQARGFDREEQANSKKKRNFFERLRDGNRDRARRNSRRNENTRRSRGGFFDIFRRQQVRSSGVEPEAPPPRPNPIKVYVANKQFSLVNGKLQQPGGEILDDSLAQTVFATLREGGSGVRLDKKQRQAVIDFYERRTYAPVWTELDGVRAKAAWVMDVLAAAKAEGLDPHDYKLSILTEVGGDIDKIESDIDALAAFEIQLTAMALRYADHAYNGRVDPNRMTSWHDLKSKKLDMAEVLTQTAESAAPDKYLLSLHPVHPAYAAFKQALADLGDSKEDDIAAPIPGGSLIRPGADDPRLELIRKRLDKLGVFEIEPTSDDGTVETVSFDNFYDEKLVSAVRAFQRNAGLTPDAIIGPATLRALNDQGGSRLHAKLIRNMERLRWLPRDLGERHVFVNQAAQMLEVRDGGEQVWETRVIVGKSQHQTNFFSDEMETVVFNPYWGVPQSIIVNEMIPDLRNDRYWLDDRDFELTDLKGRQLSSADVDWFSYGGTRTVPFNVRQRPGPTNALGEIKFLFPNKHAIYFHDTPTRNLFSRETRAFSHGCVRVQDPRKFAEVVLGWNRTSIDDAIEAGKNRKVRLKKKLPVHLTYFTAWPDEDGGIRYLTDIYSRDELIDRAFNTTKVALR